MAFSRTSVGLGLGVGIFVLTLATAVIHLYLAITAIGSMGFNFGVMLFILNGLGYLGRVAVLQLPIRQLARFRSANKMVRNVQTGCEMRAWVVSGSVQP